MKLRINGTVYTVPREYEERIFQQLWHEEALPWYQKLDRAWRVLAMPFTRGGLLLLEKEVEKTSGTEKAKLVRPPKRDSDPNLWLGELLAKMLFEGLKHVRLDCTTSIDSATGEQSITEFQLQIETGSGIVPALKQDTSKSR